LKFDLRNIVPPNEIYNGLSYGGWAATWWNWLFSNQNQVGFVYFLRGNVDTEPHIKKTGKNAIGIYSDVAIFFPIICTISCRLMISNAVNEMLRRRDATEPERDPNLLKVKINNTEIPNLHKYYAESSQFILEITRFSKLSQYFNPPVRRGRSEAVTAGYWLLLRPLPVGIYRIKFEGKHRDGFKTSGDYSIKIIKRS
jgi:hypothetical protein